MYGYITAILGKVFLDYISNPMIIVIIQNVRLSCLRRILCPLYIILSVLRRCRSRSLKPPSGLRLKSAFLQYRRALPCWGAVLTVHTGQPARKPRSTFPHQTHQKPQLTLLFALPSHSASPSHPPPPPPSFRGYNPLPLALPLAVPRLPHLHGVYNHPLMAL